MAVTAAATAGAATNQQDFDDDDLVRFAAEGVPVPAATASGAVVHDGATIHYESFGAGRPVILLHGGLGNTGNWGHQVPALVAAGYRAILIDSRGHGRSTRDDRPYSYELMGGDVLAVMDALALPRADFVGWSDGACVALILGATHPERVRSVLYFGCYMDPSGTKPFVYTEVIGRCLTRHKLDYRALSATPDDFDSFFEAVGLMQRTQPNYTAADLGAITVPVTILHAEGDEFIKREHAEHLARSIPGAKLVALEGVTHFAPVQRPARFNRAVLAFLSGPA